MINCTNIVTHEVTTMKVYRSTKRPTNLMAMTINDFCSHCASRNLNRVSVTVTGNFFPSSRHTYTGEFKGLFPRLVNRSDLRAKLSDRINLTRDRLISCRFSAFSATAARSFSIRFDPRPADPCSFFPLCLAQLCPLFLRI